jgi:hypothetical protein
VVVDRLAIVMSEEQYDYDVALSFAGEDRAYVRQVADALHGLGVRVFYDRYESAELWGKDLYTHLDEIYRKRSRYCVMFISRHYAERVWTGHERASVQARALESAQEYLLPARFDDTEIPGLRPTTGCIDLTETEPEELASLVVEKLGLIPDLEDMLSVLRDWLHKYVITVDGLSVSFKSDEENYEGSFSLRLLLEMYREGELEHLFLQPAIVPH